MAQWPALYGVFRHDDDESRLIEGVKAVLNGEQTAELSVMHPAMYAADHASAPVENSPLTERECEILNELLESWRKNATVEAFDINGKPLKAEDKKPEAAKAE